MLSGWKNTVKKFVLPKAIYRFNAIVIKIPLAFFTKLEWTILNSLWNHVRPQIAKAVLTMKNKVGGITFPDFNLHYKVIVIKTVWYCPKTRDMGQWNRIESSETNPCIYGQFMTKEPRIYNGEKTAFNKWCCEKWTATWERKLI